MVDSSTNTGIRNVPNPDGFADFSKIDTGGDDSISQRQYDQAVDAAFRNGAQALADRLKAEEKKKEEEEPKYVRLGGKSSPRDTRAAQVLAALGIETDLMKALIASAALHPNRR